LSYLVFIDVVYCVKLHSQGLRSFLRLSRCTFLESKSVWECVSLRTLQIWHIYLFVLVCDCHFGDTSTSKANVVWN